MLSSVRQTPNGPLLLGLAHLRDSHRLTQEELGQKVGIAGANQTQHVRNAEGVTPRRSQAPERSGP
jgi:hypothetical protein